MEFNSLNELKLRITPALEARVSELKNNNITDISENDIWNYFKNNKWSVASDLSLAEMVNDILTCNISDIRIDKLDDKE